MVPASAIDFSQGSIAGTFHNGESVTDSQTSFSETPIDAIRNSQGNIIADNNRTLYHQTQVLGKTHVKVHFRNDIKRKVYKRKNGNGKAPRVRGGN